MSLYAANSAMSSSASAFASVLSSSSPSRSLAKRFLDDDVFFFFFFPDGDVDVSPRLAFAASASSNRLACNVFNTA